LLHY